MKMRCPHCESPATIRNSREISNLTRESYLVCNNPDVRACVRCDH